LSLEREPAAPLSTASDAAVSPTGGSPPRRSPRLRSEPLAPSNRRGDGSFTEDLRLLVSVVAALVGCTTTVRQNPNCAAWRSQLAAVAVMPPDVKVHLVTFPSFADDEANLRGRLRGAIAKALEAHGFGVGDQGGF